MQKCGVAKLTSEPMNHKETHSSSSVGYAKPPWIFKVHCTSYILSKRRLLKLSFPRSSDWLKLLGILLVDSSSLAMMTVLLERLMRWAARVLVNSDEACIHGRKDIGLPSQVAKFSKTIKAVPKATKSTSRSFLDTFGAFVPSSPKSSMDIQVTEIKGLSAMNLCNINLSMAGVELSSKWMGPHIKMSLPSFSGRTKYNSDLLKYSCEIECRVRAVAPAKVLALSPPLPASGAVDMDEEESTKGLRKKRNLSISVLLSKPIFALEFNCLKMKVEPPKVISTPPKNSLRH